ncbi:SAM-dependent methyltransferase [Amycolatopsis sp. H20-H5]|uniref:SAM-dependent methyltransferase n=1 Tax=Amycolatopsis sp. H20-H5 TaxID=3046309 RepID=UPI002DB5B7AD|nr:SAM-dependent methyltransferase [Amycolatopsis sp. H20-H5]MEC3975416.1 SAM-dependent methyltransferase [Amycolatopsis sp. H20-H5]
MDPQQVPEGVDLERPNAARIYDWALGGSANWAIDREFGEQAVKAFPLVRTLAKVNRDFLARAVRHCVANGVTQFLDLGSGVPTVGNVHEVAGAVAADSRCVYVDNEPVAVAHSQVLLEQEGDPRRHAVLGADLRDVDEVWDGMIDTGVIDPARPIGLLTVAVLHFQPVGSPILDRVREYRELLAPGSFYLLSHVTESGVDGDELAQIRSLVKQYDLSSTPAGFRSHEQILEFFGDFELAEPGLVPVREWRPEGDSTAPISCVLGGVARKPLKPEGPR